MRPAATIALVAAVAGCATLGLAPSSFAAWLSGYGQVFTQMAPPPDAVRPDVASEVPPAGVPPGRPPDRLIYGEVACVAASRCRGNGLTEDGRSRRRIWLAVWDSASNSAGHAWIVLNEASGWSMVVGP